MLRCNQRCARIYEPQVLDSLLQVGATSTGSASQSPLELARMMEPDLGSPRPQSEDEWAVVEHSAAEHPEVNDASGLPQATDSQLLQVDAVSSNASDMEAPELLDTYMESDTLIDPESETDSDGGTATPEANLPGLLPYVQAARVVHVPPLFSPPHEDRENLQSGAIYQTPQNDVLTRLSISSTLAQAGDENSTSTPEPLPPQSGWYQNAGPLQAQGETITELERITDYHLVRGPFDEVPTDDETLPSGQQTPHSVQGDPVVAFQLAGQKIEDMRAAAALPKVKPLDVWQDRWYNIIVVGEKAIGKSTFIQTIVSAFKDLPEGTSDKEMLVNYSIKGAAKELPGHQPANKSLLVDWSHDNESYSTLQFRDPNTRTRHFFRFQDTPAVDTAAHSSPHSRNSGKCSEIPFAAIKAHVKAQDKAFSEAEQILPRNLVVDHRVDACLWFIGPHTIATQTAHNLVEMSQLVPTIPIMSKADAMTPHELEAHRKNIAKLLASVIPAGSQANMATTGRKWQSSVFNADALREAGAPSSGIFAVVGSNEMDHSVGRGWAVRKYPWGTVEAMSRAHSDLLSLKRLLFEVTPEALKLNTEARCSSARFQERLDALTQQRGCAWAEARAPRKPRTILASFALLFLLILGAWQWGGSAWGSSNSSQLLANPPNSTFKSNNQSVDGPLLAGLHEYYVPPEDTAFTEKVALLIEGDAPASESLVGVGSNVVEGVQLLLEDVLATLNFTAAKKSVFRAAISQLENSKDTLVYTSNQAMQDEGPIRRLQQPARNPESWFAALQRQVSGRAAAREADAMEQGDSTHFGKGSSNGDYFDWTSDILAGKGVAEECQADTLKAEVESSKEAETDPEVEPEAESGPRKPKSYGHHHRSNKRRFKHAKGGIPNPENPRKRTLPNAVKALRKNMEMLQKELQSSRHSLHKSFGKAAWKAWKVMKDTDSKRVLRRVLFAHAWL